MKAIRYLAMLFVLCATCSASRTLTDGVGREVTVPDHPHRLISLVPSVTDDIYELGAGDDLIARSDYTKYPAEAVHKPSVGTPLNPSIETIVAFRPDLVLVSAESNREETVHQLEHLGVSVFVLNPHGIEGILSSLLSLGKALAREQAAEQLVATLRARIRRVEVKVETQPAIRVFMPIWYDPVITIGKNAFITEVIQAAGGRSVTDDISREWPEISLETVIQRHPDALVLMKEANMSLADLERRPGWRTLDAVRNHRVYLVDDRIQLPSPVVFAAMEELAKQLHP